MFKETVKCIKRNDCCSGSCWFSGLETNENNIFQTPTYINATINGAARCYDRPFQHDHELSSVNHKTG